MYAYVHAQQVPGSYEYHYSVNSWNQPHGGNSHISTAETGLQIGQVGPSS